MADSKTVITAVVIDGRLVISLAGVPAADVDRVAKVLDMVLCHGVGYAHCSFADLIIVSTNGAKQALYELVDALGIHGIDVKEPARHLDGDPS